MRVRWRKMVWSAHGALLGEEKNSDVSVVKPSGERLCGKRSVNDRLILRLNCAVFLDSILLDLRFSER
jgi:hypothetical protein